MAITRLGPNQLVNLASNVTGTLPAANVANSTLNNVTALPAAIATGSLVKIAEADYSSGVSSVTMTDCFTSTYSVYKYYLYDLHMASNNSELRIYFKDSSANNVGNFQYVANETYITIDSSTSNHSHIKSSGNDFIRVSDNDLDSISDQPSILELTIFQPYESEHTTVDVRYHLRSDNNYLYNYIATATLRSTTSLRSLTISNDSGINFAGYKSVIYGVKK